MVTGTIVFGPLGLYGQSDMDFIDSHAYWQHPRFPRRDWDPGDWVIEQKAMSDYPEQGTLFQMAAERLAGKPFTVTEYNHPAPLDSQAECVPMIASFAAAQNWDGVWLYTYAHGNAAWDRRHLNSYFDIDTNPAKWGFMPAGAAVFRDESLQPFSQLATACQQRLWKALAGLHLKAGRHMLAAIGPTAKLKHSPFRGSSYIKKARYAVEVIDGKPVCGEQCGCQILTGSTERFQSLSMALPSVVSTGESGDYRRIAGGGGTAKPLGAGAEDCFTACGRCENTGMQFSEDRTTVGRNWGNAPVQIEAVEGVIQFDADSPFGGPGVVCKPLNPDGSVRQSYPISNGRIPLSATFETMWYLVERETL
jgi:hypothetical protein